MTVSIEINAFCILLFGIIFFDSKRKEVTKDQKLFYFFILDAFVFCVADLFAYILNGRGGAFTWFTLYFVNFLYFSTSAIASYIWYLFVLERIGIHKGKKQFIRHILILPLFLFMVVTALSPVLKFVFYLKDTDGLYSYVRGNGLCLHWLVAWGYLVGAFILALVYLVKEKDKNVQKEILPLFLFPVFPFLGSVLQIFWGYSLIQIGMALSAVFVHIKLQDSHVWTDTLTTLPNRSYFDRYLSEKMKNLAPTDSLFLIIVDIDNLKSINDLLGHKDGDGIIKQLGYIMKKISNEYVRTFVSRYDGDEFAFFGYNHDIVKFQEIIDLIHKRVEEWNRINSYSIDISVGYVKGTKTSFMNSDQLIDLAEMEMRKNQVNKM